MTSILDKVGIGWDNIDVDEYFKNSMGGREDVMMTNSKQFEECHILFWTMSCIKVTHVLRSKKNKRNFERVFEIRCELDKYQETNTSIRERHSVLFKKSIFDFYPTRDLIMSMPFSDVDRLKPDVWTKLNKHWLKGVHSTLRQASLQSIEKVRFVRRITRNDITSKSDEYSNPIDRNIYEIILNNKEQTKLFVNYSQIHDVIGEEEWMNGEMNCICYIGGHRILSLTWGSKKKSKSKEISVGDIVSVSNHGTKTVHLAKVLEIKEEENIVKIKWQFSGRNDFVGMSDCRAYDVELTSQRKRKETDRYSPQQDAKVKRNQITNTLEAKITSDSTASIAILLENNVESIICPDGEIENRFYSKTNVSKLCAEGAIANLMNMLHMSSEDMSLFWQLIQQIL